MKITSSPVIFFQKTPENEIHFKDWECCICYSKNAADEGGTVAQKVDKIYHIYHYKCLVQNSEYSSRSPLTRKNWDLTSILDPKRRPSPSNQVSLRLKSLAQRIAQSPPIKTALGALLVATGVSSEIHLLTGLGLIVLQNGLSPVDAFLMRQAKQYRKKANEANKWVQFNQGMGLSKRLIKLAKKMVAHDNRAAETIETISTLFSCVCGQFRTAGAYISVYWLAGKIHL
jgi:hypothetical protein